MTVEVDKEALPTNWVVSTLKETTYIQSGIGFPKDKQGHLDGEVPFYKVGDISQAVLSGSKLMRKANNYVSLQEVKSLKGKLLPVGAVVFAKIGEAIKLNRRAILTQESLVDNNVMGVKAADGIDDLYLYYYLTKIKLDSLAKATTVPSIRKSQIEDIQIPVAPPEQQKRIVAKIEELFSHIDAGIEALKKAKQLLKQYRQSVLKAAVTGELTKEWREASEAADIDGLTDLISKHLGKGFTKYEEVQDKKGWIKIVLKDISTRVSVGHVGKTSEFYCDESDGVPFLRSQNVRPGKVVFEGSKYITKEFHKSLKKSQLQVGDLLIVRVGANRGDAAVMPEFEGDINCANIVFARSPKELGGYLDVYFQSKLWTDLVDSLTTGSAQGVINTKTVEKVELEIPPLEEMEKILAIIEEKSSGISRLESELDSQLIKSVISKQSVLASAFSGKICQ